MTCEELRPNYELHALGILEEPERSELIGHLERGCPLCAPGIRKARETNVCLQAGLPLVDPPARLRRRVLASVGVERYGWIPAWAAVLATLVVAVLWLSLDERRQRADLTAARRTVAEVNAQLQRNGQAIEFLSEPDTLKVVFGTNEAKPPRGNVLVNPRRGVLLIASNLPPAAVGKTYEMWLVPKSGAPKPAGIFQSEVNGTARHLLEGPVDLNSTAAVAVSLEPEGGSQAPTAVLFAASLKGE